MHQILQYLVGDINIYALYNYCIKSVYCVYSDRVCVSVFMSYNFSLLKMKKLLTKMCTVTALYKFLRMNNS